MKVLIVDASSLARDFIKDELAAGGFELFEAGNQEEALEVLTTVPEVNLMTLGVAMKKTSGFDFLQYLQSGEMSAPLQEVGNHQVPAIFVTSRDTDRDRLRGFQVGAADFIQKPWQPGGLLKHVQAVLGPGSEFSEMSVLMVDDNRTARQFIRTCLSRLGVRILEAEDGDQALEILRGEENKVDLVVTDLDMVRMDGDALVVAIRGELGLTDLPVIFLSGNEDKDRVLSLFKMGATDYLKKPFLKEELVSRLRAYLNRVQVQNQLRNSVAELKELNQVKDQFLAACSHDLRSPLTGILGYAQLLEDDASLPAGAVEMVSGIRKSGEYLLALINDLLDIGKMASGKARIKREVVDLIAVVEDSARSLVHTAGPKGVSLNQRCSSEDARLAGDRPALMRLCNNLLSNAIKFTPEGGQVDISVRDGLPGTMVLTVADTGIGIPPEAIPKLFQRYTSVSQSGTSGEKGTGLGLSIAQELVEAHGGTIEVESTVGEGTTFRVQLPKLAADENPTEVEEDPAEEPLIQLDLPSAEPSGGEYSVLLVDDQEVNRKVGSALLKKMGFQVDTATDGAEALDLYRKSCRARRYDLILMDMEMPVMGGLEATRKLRKYEEGLPEDHLSRANPVPVLAMTANSTDVSLGECLSAGMNDFLTKPFVVGQISEAVEQWVLEPV